MLWGEWGGEKAKRGLCSGDAAHGAASTVVFCRSVSVRSRVGEKC